MVAPDKLTRGMVIDKELKAEIERRYNGWDDLCQQLADSQKQVALLRGMIAIAALHVQLYDDLTEALAATEQKL